MLEPETAATMILGWWHLRKKCADLSGVICARREAALNLFHRAGIRQISARLRYHSQHLTAALALLLAHPPTRA